ncbi:hypothetical protein [Flavilitoribacter nigricans]|uniref:Uncharacterized protein n=1 Tax=Flavilitoribacter nigricans (strain ATCC 23147 / DSM 23189 / NBRC 102662 / NCIMB 1420 / SS-2) TaxID=1122177 RepID=A0A2D0N0T2_FLAN2|nr:hypothetical protein [Flavilitoribacter nigricans]PHN01976.1 hypothetical protein CRP01_34285 [Flavilitoribacter nigricans DSM 23189 = NBRC 102662]
MKYLFLFFFLPGLMWDLAAQNYPCDSDLEFQADLAFRWAPIHHQDIDSRKHSNGWLPWNWVRRTCKHGLQGRADLITAFDFDRDSDTSNNWENLKRGLNHDISPVCYYSVVETASHWYIVYAFYHPRDWECPGESSVEGQIAKFFPEKVEHENDMEGLLAIVHKDGTTFGTLQSIVTVAHNSFYSFIPAGSSLQGSVNEDQDGTLQFATLAEDGLPHPVTAQEARGHGLKAEPEYRIDGDGVIYSPTKGERVAPADPKYAAEDILYGKYALISIFDETAGLWNKRCPRASYRVFEESSGQFIGDYGESLASPPWKWDDTDGVTVDLPGIGPVSINGTEDGLPAGWLAIHPADVAKHYFRGFSPGFSSEYLFNPYTENGGLPVCEPPPQERVVFDVRKQGANFDIVDFCLTTGIVPTYCTYGHDIQVLQASYSSVTGERIGFPQPLELNYQVFYQLERTYAGTPCADCEMLPLTDQSSFVEEHVRIERNGTNISLRFFDENDELPANQLGNSFLADPDLIEPYANKARIQIKVIALLSECDTIEMTASYSALDCRSLKCPGLESEIPQLVRDIDILIDPIRNLLVIYSKGKFQNEFRGVFVRQQFAASFLTLLERIPRERINQVYVLGQETTAPRTSTNATMIRERNTQINAQFRQLRVEKLDIDAFDLRMQQSRE